MHNHHHHDPTPNFNRAFLIGTVLNVGFVGVEVVFGFLNNSLALLADAAHNLGDVLGLLLAWGASWLVQRRPTKRYTYGLRRSSILVAILNATILLFAMGAIALEAIQRFLNPVPVGGNAVSVLLWLESSSTVSPPGCSTLDINTTSISKVLSYTWLLRFMTCIFGR